MCWYVQRCNLLIIVVIAVIISYCVVVFLACKPGCLTVGLGFCTTSIGGDESQTCCSYWHQAAGQSTRVCAQKNSSSLFTAVGQSTKEQSMCNNITSFSSI